MSSAEEKKRLLGVAVGISVFPITMLMITHQPDESPLITIPNCINFIIGIVSAGLSGTVTAKVIQRRSNSRSTYTVLFSVTIGAIVGTALFALLSEVTMQLRQ